MLKSLKEKIYIAKETVRGYWYALTHLKDDDDDSWESFIEEERRLARMNPVRWYPGIDRDKAPDDNDFERHQLSEEQRLARMGRGISVVDEYGDVDIPRNGERPYNWVRIHPNTYQRVPSYAASSSSGADYRTDYRECKKHGDNVVFYDLKKHFECPICVEERERIQIVDFLTESEMNL